MLRSIHSLSRWQAFALHLLMSMAVLTAILIPVFLLWYPAPYYWIVDIWTVLQVLILVDVILGPLLTLVVFKPGKKSLRFDLSCIAVLQIVALSYGVSMIYLSRPYFLVFAIDRFNVVSSRDVDMDSLADPSLIANLQIGPYLVYAERPSEPKARQQMLQDSLSGGPDLERRPAYYRPYDEHSADVLSRAKPLADLATTPDNTAAIAAFIAEHGGAEDDYRYFPLVGRSEDIAQVINAEDAALVGHLFVDPW